MALPQSRMRFTPEEYLAFERASETKHEYLDGQIYAMAGASPLHNQICFNVTVAIGSRLRGTSCYGYTSDQKVRTDPLDLFSYPDLTIVCGEPRYHDEQNDVILNPGVIIEVLSPTTESYDRGEKFAHYRQTKSLTDYILIAQDRPGVEHYSRQKGKRQWLFDSATEMSAEITIDSIKCRLKLADIYDPVVFPPRKLPMADVVEKPATVRTTRQKKAK
ncbi:MAG: Uma2 family endonuclease [Blastocatellia bacterium]